MTDQTITARDPVRIALESIENFRGQGPDRVGLAVLFPAAAEQLFGAATEEIACGH